MRNFVVLTFVSLLVIATLGYYFLVAPATIVLTALDDDGQTISSVLGYEVVDDVGVIPAIQKVGPMLVFDVKDLSGFKSAIYTASPMFGVREPVMVSRIVVDIYSKLGILLDSVELHHIIDAQPGPGMKYAYSWSLSGIFWKKISQGSENRFLIFGSPL